MDGFGISCERHQPTTCWDEMIRAIVSRMVYICCMDCGVRTQRLIIPKPPWNGVFFPGTPPSSKTSLKGPARREVESAQLHMSPWRNQRDGMQVDWTGLTVSLVPLAVLHAARPGATPLKRWHVRL